MSQAAKWSQINQIKNLKNRKLRQVGKITAGQTLMPKVEDMMLYLKQNQEQTQWSESFGEQRPH